MFKQDLAQAKKAENYVCDFLKKWYPNSCVFDGKNKGYDIDVVDKGEKMEVKYDRKARETGNLVVEYECNGKPSGIEATTSHRWCLIYYYEGWKFSFVEVGVLKEICTGKRVVSGGDNMLSRMYLITAKEFHDHPFVKTFPLEK